MTEKKSVLVVCIHNSARSQMAEEYLRLFGGDLFEVGSAGLNPGKLNPVVVEALLEDGIDIRTKKTRSTQELLDAGAAFHYVITVCDKQADEECPWYPGQIAKLHLPFPDPSSFTGTDEEKLEGTRTVRDRIKSKMKEIADRYRSTGEMPRE
jgi:arsenate reductase